MKEPSVKQDRFCPITQRRISHSNVTREDVFNDIESIQRSEDSALIEDKDDLNEISSLLSIIPKSTNSQSRDLGNNDISNSQEILRILRYSKINRHNSCCNVNGYHKTVSLTGRVIQSDSNVLRLTSKNPFERHIPERVQNPFVKNFLESEDYL